MAQAPVIVISDLAQSPGARRLIAPMHLAPLMSDIQRDLYVIQWAREWQAGGGERFNPILRDLDLLIGSATPDAGKIHLVSLGSGAIPAFKWLTYCARENKSTTQVASFTLLAPSLSVHERTPRTSLTQAPRDMCVIGEESDDLIQFQELLSTAVRLPHEPSLCLVRGPESYLWSDTISADRAQVLQSAVEFSGSWKHAWRDWIVTSDKSFANYGRTG
ncbi:hypothetical protein [Shimia sp.]|uniref:hypothetical protein n=1 Tax=Shimia sp. TaxID=1954381 RepID=UPI003296E9A3